MAGGDMARTVAVESVHMLIDVAASGDYWPAATLGEMMVYAELSYRVGRKRVPMR